MEIGRTAQKPEEGLGLGEDDWYRISCTVPGQWLQCSLHQIATAFTASSAAPYANDDATECTNDARNGKSTTDFGSTETNEEYQSAKFRGFQPTESSLSELVRTAKSFGYV